jgi:hypothetical protein
MRDLVGLIFLLWFVTGVVLASGWWKLLAVCMPLYALYVTMAWLIGMVSNA